MFFTWLINKLKKQQVTVTTAGRELRCWTVRLTWGVLPSTVPWEYGSRSLRKETATRTWYLFLFHSPQGCAEFADVDYLWDTLRGKKKKTETQNWIFKNIQKLIKKSHNESKNEMDFLHLRIKTFELINAGSLSMEWNRSDVPLHALSVGRSAV